MKPEVGDKSIRVYVLDTIPEVNTTITLEVTSPDGDPTGDDTENGGGGDFGGALYAGVAAAAAIVILIIILLVMVSRARASAPVSGGLQFDGGDQSAPDIFGFGDVPSSDVKTGLSFLDD